MQNSLSLVTFVLGSLVTVMGYPNGKISASCDTMLPVHGGSLPQSSAAPYTITVSHTSFVPGDIITVTIQSNSSNVGFRGFLLEARSVGGNRITGTFTTTGGNTQTLTCSVGANSAVSHTNSNLKQSITASWTAPEGEGPVRFRATVLSSYFTFWTGVESATIVALQMSNITCGTQKFCLTDPVNCSPSDSACLFMSSAPSSNGYIFEMSGPTSGYVAIAFSNDAKMGNDDVYICTRSSGNITVQRASNTGAVTSNITDRSTIGYIVTSYNSGVLKCSFITQSSIATPHRSSATSSYYVSFASGPLKAGGQSLQQTKTFISSSKVDLSSFLKSGTQSGISPSVKWHGALSLVAWMTISAIGIIMASFMSNVADKPFLGKPLWFQIHVAFMTLTVILTVIAFIIVFVAVAGWSSDKGAHPILGCIVMILSFLQPFVALCRPNPDPDSRRYLHFQRMHRLKAFVIKTLAGITIFTGLRLVDTSPTQWLHKVMAGFSAWEFLGNLILEINKRLQAKGKYHVSNYKVEIACFAILICGNLAFLIALLVGIGNS